jgi:hypothetical protein
MTVVLAEWESKERLGPGLVRPREAITSSVEDATGFARAIGGSVVAKASGVAHKSEHGLVRTDLDAGALRACWPELAAAGDGRVLVAEQLAGSLELIVGGVRDPAFGPVVVIGFGGVNAELLGDTACVLAPSEPGEVDRAISTLRGAPLLDGFRGAEPLDRAALSEIVEVVGALLIDDPTVLEIDCNPVLVVDGRPVVADVLVVLEGDGA